MLPLCYALLLVAATVASHEQIENYDQGYIIADYQKAGTQQKSIRINCGGPDYYRDNDGNVWVGDAMDEYYNTGLNFSTPYDVKATLDADLYSTERYDLPTGKEMIYEIPVQNGTYDVLLHFAEIWKRGQEPNARKFNVVIEGIKFLEEYDMFAIYGGYTAIVESFTTVVEDGSLTIAFEHGSIQNPKIGAIEVHLSASTGPNSAPTLKPTKSPTSSSSLAPASSPIPGPTLSPTPAPTPSTTSASTPSPTPSPTPSSTSGSTQGSTPALTPNPTSAPIPRPTVSPTDASTTVPPPGKPSSRPEPPLASSAPTSRPMPRDNQMMLRAWNQTGNITWMSNGGTPFDDNCLSMSIDGQVIAVGQTEDSIPNTFKGRVDIFQYNDFFEAWGRFPDPSIERRDDPLASQFGFSISLNQDGTVIAIGDVGNSLIGSKGRAFVYEYRDLSWIQKGQTINPGGGIDDLHAGRTVSLGADGNTVAVVMQIKSRTPGPPTFVRIFRFDSERNLWTPKGSDIFGHISTANDPFAVDLCKNGNTLAISSLVPGTGYVEVYKYNGIDWALGGEPIGAIDEVNEAVGITVSLSESGDTVAFGVRLFQSSNLVRVYKFDGRYWNQVLNDIVSGGEVGARRMSLALSSDGRRVAVGPQDRTPSSRIFELGETSWVQVGQELASDQLLSSGFQLQTVELSGDGKRVSLFGTGGEHVAVYDEVKITSRE